MVEINHKETMTLFIALLFLVKLILGIITLGGLSGSFHANLTDSFTLTSTNSSNSVSASIS